MRILITGCYGQVGWELQRTLAVLGEIIAIDVEDLNLCNPKAIAEAVRTIKPDIIVNSAAYTAVDKAESDAEAAMMVNGIAPGIFAEEAKRLNAILVHFSTDYVFNGKSTVPYKESDLPAPINIYGKTKLAGDQAVMNVGGKYLIFRTSWVYGNRGKNFLLTMLKLAKEKEELKIVNDQVGAPTWSKLIAQSVALVLAKNLSKADGHWGLYNLTSAGSTSWCEFAKMIFSIKQKDPIFRFPQVIGIPTHEYPLPAVRPQNSVLLNEKLFQDFNIKMPSWEKTLELCMQDFLH